MAHSTTLDMPTLSAARLERSRPGARAVLTLLMLTAIGGSVALGHGATSVEPDLARMIRSMAAIKGGFGLAAFAACLWRLARPATGWRGVVYVAGPPLMAAGSIALWNMDGIGLAALGLHAGLVAVVAAALTDRDFVTLTRASVAVSPRRGRWPRSAPASAGSRGSDRRHPEAAR